MRIDREIRELGEFKEKWDEWDKWDRWEITHRAKRYPSSEALLFILLKGQNRNGRTSERIGNLGRIRNLGNLGKDYH